MKTLRLIPALFLSLLIAGVAGCLVGCDTPDGDFWGDRATIIEKTQTKNDKEKQQARYKIAFNTDKYIPRWYIMPENFGEVGDTIHATNRMLCASPIKVENER